MPTYRVPYEEDDVSDSESEPPLLCRPAPKSSLKTCSSPKPAPEALFVTEQRESLRQSSRNQLRGLRRQSQDVDGGHFSFHNNKKREADVEAKIGTESIEVSKSPQQAANGSKSRKNHRSLAEIINAPWSDDEEEEFLVKSAPCPIEDLRKSKSALFESSSTPRNKENRSSNGATLPPQPSADNVILPTSILNGAYDYLKVPRTESYVSINAHAETVLERQGAKRGSIASHTAELHDHTGSQQRSFTAPSSQTCGQIGEGKEHEEGLMIDDFLLNLFNGWDLLDYQQYLWRIEGSLTTEIRRNNTWLMGGSSATLLAYDYYNENNPLQKMTTSRKIILFERLPLPDTHQQFCGDAYLLGYDANRRELFARRFYHGLPTILAKLPQFWDYGTEVFRVPVGVVIRLLVSSLLDDTIISLPRLIGSVYCKVEGYHEWLGMEIVILIRFGQWVLDFAEVLFGDEEDVMDVLGALGKALDQWRLVIQRASSDAWRAYDNKLSRATYSQKLSANEELVTNLHTLSSKCCFSREFLAGSVARPRGLGLDKVWLGKFQRQQDLTERSVERVGQRLSALFERPLTPPLPENPVSKLSRPLAWPGLLSSSANVNAVSHRTSNELCSPPRALQVLSNVHIPRSPPTPALSSLPPAHSLSYARSSHWPESDLPACRSVDGSGRSSAPSLNNSNIHHPHAPYTTKPLGPLQRLLKTTATTEKENEVGPFQRLSMDQRDDESLAGLLNGLYKVVAGNPELDNRLIRQKLGAVLKELREQASDEMSTGNCETTADAQNSSTDASNKVEGNGRDSESKSRKAGLNPLLHFIPNWF